MHLNINTCCHQTQDTFSGDSMLYSLFWNSATQSVLPWRMCSYLPLPSTNVTGQNPCSSSWRGKAMRTSSAVSWRGGLSLNGVSRKRCTRVVKYNF